MSKIKSAINYKKTTDFQPGLVHCGLVSPIFNSSDTLVNIGLANDMSHDQHQVLTLTNANSQLGP